MGSQGPSRRPFCLQCSKPARLCLCSRLKCPPLENPIAVTILQHSLEMSHPLNSTRVAKLGLKNLSVVPVTDVNFQARFFIEPLRPNQAPQKPNFQIGFPDDLDRGSRNGCTSGKCDKGSYPSSMNDLEISLENLDLDQILGTKQVNSQSEEFESVDGYFTATFPKFKVFCSPSDISITIERGVKPNMSSVLATPVGRAARSNGFTVKKMQRKQVGQTEEFRDFEEFNVVMPPGSAVLFPSEKSIGLDALDFEVKHLVVLDGTWAKAKRMYHENPWLKLLPCLRLDLKEKSLYSEVRHQPKAGCLSTIESIVCAMKALGGCTEGLDELLDVFESMIGDQRRCKDEKFKALSLS